MKSFPLLHTCPFIYSVFFHSNLIYFNCFRPRTSHPLNSPNTCSHRSLFQLRDQVPKPFEPPQTLRLSDGLLVYGSTNTNIHFSAVATTLPFAWSIDSVRVCKIQPTDRPELIKVKPPTHRHPSVVNQRPRLAAPCEWATRGLPISNATSLRLIKIAPKPKQVPSSRLRAGSSSHYSFRHFLLFENLHDTRL